MFKINKTSETNNWFLVYKEFYCKIKTNRLKNGCKCSLIEHNNNPSNKNNLINNYKAISTDIQNNLVILCVLENDCINILKTLLNNSNCIKFDTLDEKLVALNNLTTRSLRPIDGLKFELVSKNTPLEIALHFDSVEIIDYLLSQCSKDNTDFKLESINEKGLKSLRYSLDPTRKFGFYYWYSFNYNRNQSEDKKHYSLLLRMIMAGKYYYGIQIINDSNFNMKWNCSNIDDKILHLVCQKILINDNISRHSRNVKNRSMIVVKQLIELLIDKSKFNLSKQIVEINSIGQLPVSCFLVLLREYQFVLISGNENIDQDYNYNYKDGMDMKLTDEESAAVDIFKLLTNDMSGTVIDMISVKRLLLAVCRIKNSAVAYKLFQMVLSFEMNRINYNTSNTTDDIAIGITLLETFDNNNNLFCLACENGHLALVSYIYNILVSMVIMLKNEKDSINDGTREMVFEYLNYKCNNKLSAYYGKTPYIRACANGHIEIVRFLIDKCSDFVDITIGKETVFSRWIFVEYFIKRGSDYFKCRFAENRDGESTRVDKPKWNQQDENIYNFILQNEKKRIQDNKININPHQSEKC